MHLALNDKIVPAGGLQSDFAKNEIATTYMWVMRQLGVDLTTNSAWIDPARFAGGYTFYAFNLRGMKANHAEIRAKFTFSVPLAEPVVLMCVVERQRTLSIVSSGICQVV